MSSFDNLFTSPQEQAGRSTYRDIMNQLDVNDIPTLQKNYGLTKNVNAAFDPARGTLATRKANSMRGAAMRMGANNAMPGVTFGDIDSDYAVSEGNLESAAAKGWGSLTAVRIH